MPLILGTSASETLDGTDTDDEFVGGPGDDTLNGLGGNDVFRWVSGDGVDQIDGGAGQDKAVVTFTDNTGFANQQFRLFSNPAGDGRAVLQYGTGAPGNPITSVNFLRNVEEFQIRISEAIDLTGATIIIGNLTGTGVTGAVEVDNFSNSDLTINGTDSANPLRMIGADANERLLGGTGNDSLHGGGGNDYLFAGGGANEMVGGFGDDTYRATGLDTILELPGRGFDTVVTSDATFNLRDNIESLIFVEGGTGTTNFTGIGNVENNYIEGALGADYLIGVEGNDVLAGGAGAANALQGGVGDDTYIVSVAGDTITEFAGEGNDTVQTSLDTYTLPANVENLRFTNTGGTLFGLGSTLGIGTDAANRMDGGSGRDTLRGGDGDDLILGNDGDDFLDGGAGNDLLVGGLGADELRGGLGADLYIYSQVPDRPDLIHDFTRADLDKIDVSALLDNLGATGDPFAGGYLRLASTTFAGQPSTTVFVDPDGSAGPAGEVVLISVLGDVPLTPADFNI